MEEIFEVMEENRNMIVEPEKGALVLIVKTVKKNKIVEIPSEIKLVEVKKGGMEGEIIEELKNLRHEMEELKKKVGWMEPVVKGIQMP